jgi:sugar lactone lactonase YvrE
MTDLKLCKIIDTIENIKRLRGIIETPCGKFLIGIEGHSIFRYCLKTKQKFRIAGSVEQRGCQDGTRDESRFNYPQGLTLSKNSKTLFISDSENRVIRVICVESGITTTFTGQIGCNKFIDGPKERACFGFPISLKLSPNGYTLYVADFFRLRSICITTGKVDTIDRFKQKLNDFTLSPDGKHIFICNFYQIIKYKFETWESEIVFQGYRHYVGCELSKDGQLLFLLNSFCKYIKVVNLVTNEAIDTIHTLVEANKLSISTNGKQLYIIDDYNDKVQICDISEYCTNFKTFLKFQLSKHSFLPRQMIKRFN